MKLIESALGARGARVTVFNLGPGRPVAPQVVNFDTRNRVRETLQLLRALLLSDSDVHHYISASYRSFWLGALCIFLARLTGKKIVISFVGGAFKDFVCSLNAVTRAAATLSLRLSHAVIACNAEIEEVLKGVVPGKGIMRMNNCFPIVEKEQTSLPASVSDFAGKHSPLISATGATSREYGLLDAVEALRLLRGRFQNAGLVVAVTKYGNRAYEEELVDRIDSLGLREHVLIVKDLPDFTATMKRSGVFLRSTLVDGDSISVREAILLGVPTVASDTPFRPEGVILFKKGDALDMAEKLARALESDSEPRAARAQEESESNLDTLAEIYDAVRGARQVPRPDGKHPYSNRRPGYGA